MDKSPKSKERVAHTRFHPKNMASRPKEEEVPYQNRPLFYIPPTYARRNSNCYKCCVHFMKMSNSEQFACLISCKNSMFHSSVPQILDCLCAL